jgi:hypothetical protein
MQVYREILGDVSQYSNYIEELYGENFSSLPPDVLTTTNTC